MGVLDGHLDSVIAVAFSPDGSRVVTASTDHTAKLWPATPRGWLRSGCELLDGLPEYAEVAEICAALPRSRPTEGP